MPIVPCSAWCRPEEGIHVLLACNDIPTIEEDRRVYLGRLCESVDVPEFPHRCIPRDTQYVVLAIDEAPESNVIPPPQWPYVRLETVQVL